MVKFSLYEMTELKNFFYDTEVSKLGKWIDFYTEPSTYNPELSFSLVDYEELTFSKRLYSHKSGLIFINIG